MKKALVIGAGVTMWKYDHLSYISMHCPEDVSIMITDRMLSYCEAAGITSDQFPGQLYTGTQESTYVPYDHDIRPGFPTFEDFYMKGVTPENAKGIKMIQSCLTPKELIDKLVKFGYQDFASYHRWAKECARPLRSNVHIKTGANIGTAMLQCAIHFLGADRIATVGVDFVKNDEKDMYVNSWENELQYTIDILNDHYRQKGILHYNCSGAESRLASKGTKYCTLQEFFDLS